MSNHNGLQGVEGECLKHMKTNCAYCDTASESTWKRGMTIIRCMGSEARAIIVARLVLIAVKMIVRIFEEKFAPYAEPSDMLLIDDANHAINELEASK